MAINIPNVREKNGSYEIRISCGYDVHGKQIRRTKTYRPDKDMTERQLVKALQTAVSDFEQELKQGAVIKPAKFKDVAETWFNDVAIPNHRNTTLYYEKKMTKRTYKAIGHIYIDKLNFVTVQLSLTG